MHRVKNKIVTLLLALGIAFQIMPCIYAEEADNGMFIDENFDAYTDTSQIKTFSFPNPVDVIDDEKNGKALKLKLTADQDNTMFTYNFKEPIKTGCYRLSYRVNPGEGVSTHVTIDDSSAANHFTTMFMEWTGKFSSGYCWVDPKFTLGTFPKRKWYTVTSVIDLDSGAATVTMEDEEGNTYVAPNKSLQMDSTRITDISRIRFQMWSNANSESLFDDIKFEKVPYGAGVEKIGPGNIASNIRECKATVNISNYTSEKALANIEYDIYDDNNVFLETRNVKQEIEPDKTTPVEIDLDVGKYGIFNARIHTEISNGSGTKKESYDTEYSYSKITGQKNGYNSNFVTACFDFRTPYNDSVVELADIAGLGEFRNGLYWWECEEEKGVYNFPDTMTVGFDKLHDAGMDDLLILMGHNPLYMDNIPSSGVVMPDTDEAVEAFGKWCGAVAEYYKGKVNNFEIWNEPNVNGFNVRSAGGTYYTKLLRTAHKYIKAANPNAKVIGLGGANYDYMKGCLEADPDMLQYCDAVSIHPYDSNYKDDPKFPDKWLKQFADLKELMAQYGEVKPIWNTEMGWAVYDDSNYDNPWHDPSTEHQQAQNLVMAATVLQAYNAAEKMYIYCFMDPGTDNEEAEHRWGILTNYQQTADGGLHTKKSYVAISAYNNFMSDTTEYEKSAEKDLSKTAAYSYKLKDGGNLGILWSKFKGEMLSLNLGCDSVELYDMYGNFIDTMHSDNGVFYFGVSENLYYIKGRFASFELADEKFSYENYCLSGPVSDTVSLYIGSDDQKAYTVKNEVTSSDFEFDTELTMSGEPIKLSYKSIGSNDGKFPIRIKIYDGERLVFVNDDFITICNSTNVEISAKQVSKYNDTRWQLEAKIENAANEMELSGKCTVVAPNEFADILEPIQFKSIKPKSSKTLIFNIPEFIKKRTKNVVVKVESDNGYSEEYKQAMDFTSAKYAYTKPKIDGVVSQNEWNTGCAAADDEYNVNVLLFAADHVWKGKEDLSIPRIQLMWDEDNFYLHATVCDDHYTLIPDAAILWDLWKYDSLQFGIEDINGNGAGAVNKAFTEIGVAQKESGEACVYRYSSLYGKSSEEIANCEAAVKKDGNMMVYELSIPWTELFTDDYILDPNKKYGFSMLVNDNDGSGRWGFINYNDGIGVTKDAVLFGKLKLYK